MAEPRLACVNWPAPFRALTLPQKGQPPLRGLVGRYASGTPASEKWYCRQARNLSLSLSVETGEVCLRCKLLVNG